MRREGYLVHTKLQAVPKKSVAPPIIEVPTCVCWCSIHSCARWLLYSKAVRKQQPWDAPQGQGGWQLVVMGGLAGLQVPGGAQSHGSQTRRKEERRGWRVAQPAIRVAEHVRGDEAGLGSREVRSVGGDHVCDSNQGRPPPSDLQASPSWWGKAKVRVLAWWTNGSGKDSCSRSKYWYIAGFCY